MITARLEQGKLIVTMSVMDGVRLLAAMKPAGIAGELADALKDLDAASPAQTGSERLLNGPGGAPIFEGFESDDNGQGHRTRSAEEARDAEK
jgi:hypothetical protein